MALDFVNPTETTDDAEAIFSWSDSYQKYTYFGLLGFVGLLIYAYWNTLTNTAAFWTDDQYSHGYLMPFIAIYLAWSMRPNPTAQQPPEGIAEETFAGLIPASMLFKAGIGLGVVAFLWNQSLGTNSLDDSPTLAGMAIGGLASLSVLSMLAYTLVGQPFKQVSAGERWAGLTILLAAGGIRYFGAWVFSQPLNRYSFIVSLVGAFLLIGGWSLLRWTIAGIGFLFFMFPLPTVLERMLLLNLQKVAAVLSEVFLTIINQPVTRAGNKLVIDGIPLEVAEACSGLRMVTIFGGLAVACALFIKRPWWDRLIVLLSGIPIALAANVVRIVTTALLFRMFPEGDWIHTIIHDYPGFAMMFIALGLLYLELKLLSMLSTEEEEITSYGGGSLGQIGPSPGA